MRWIARTSTLVVLLAATGAGAAVARAPAAGQVPFRLLSTHAPLIMVKIQGRDIPLWLDLGAATPLILHPALLASLQTTPTGESVTSVGMEGIPNTSPVVKLARAELGGFTFAQLSVIQDAHDEAYLSHELPPGRGAVGAGFFAGYQVVIDYHRQRLTLIPEGTPSSGRTACRGRDVPLIQDSAIDWGLVSRADTDLGERLFVWDTGSPGMVMRKSALAAAESKAPENVTLVRMQMNGHDFGPLTFKVWDFPAPEGLAGFIGYNFFASHVVCVDFPGHRMLVR